MSEFIEIELTGPIPSKKNSKRIVKAGKTGRSMLIGSSAYLGWKKSAAAQIRGQYGGGAIKQVWRVQLFITYGDLRKRDLTNTAESVMDALVDAGVIEDDNWQVTGAVLLFPFYEKGKFGCRVNIWPSIKGGDGR